MIKSADDWFRVASDNAPQLATIMARFLGVNENEQSWKQFILDECTARRWTVLANAFNNAWFLAPDEPYLHEIKGWSELCDLCSETWVFEKKERLKEPL